MSNIAILGGGNLGRAIAQGLVAAGVLEPGVITLTRRSQDALLDLGKQGFLTSSDNAAAVAASSIVLVTVRPKQIDGVLGEIAEALDPDRHVLISTATDVRIEDIRRRIGTAVPVVRAMPNIGVAVGESMTCLDCADGTPERARDAAVSIFEALGKTAFVDEEQMTPATALCACGIAFFLRAIRAASQGGVQVGFHADQAIRLAAQTAKGAAELVLAEEAHPEALIDRVTTPLGVTIAGLNEMEHHGFGSALIRGIVVSAEKAHRLYLERNPRDAGEET
ncbi:MAG: pyrroline-5-carboxylate reductase [Candidatus Bipolaricaulia bacterium]